MSKVYKISEEIKTEIKLGRHGQARSRFMTVRELAERTRTSLATAQKILSQLKKDGILIADSTNPAIISPRAVRAGAGAPKRIGVVVTHIASPFFSTLAQNIQATAAEQGYQTLVASTEYDFSREREVVENFLEIGVEGLLICPGLDERCARFYRQLMERHIPLVLVSRRIDELECDFVAAHNLVGGAAVAEHLLSKGYGSFGYIAFGSRLKRDERLQGYRSALAESGAQLGDRYIADGDGWDIHHGYDAMKKLMSQDQPPRAVFAFNDLLAIGAMRYCQDHGIAIPGQVAIAGFDDLPESRVTIPPLTTVEYPTRSMARLAVQSLLDKASRTNEETFNRILLEPRVVVRQSTDPDAPSPSQLPRTSGDAYKVI